MDRGTLQALEEYAALAAFLLLGGLAVPYVPRIARFVVRLGRRLGLVRPEPEPPSGRPLEQIADDLRRLRPEARNPRAGISMARQRGVVAAYDDTLLAACRALAIETDLGATAGELERDAERLRIEFELERAGLDIGPPWAA